MISRVQSPYSDAEVLNDQTQTLAENARRFGEDLARCVDRAMVRAITGLDLFKQERRNPVRDWLR